MKRTEFDESGKYKEFEEARKVWGHWMSEDEDRPLPARPDIYSNDIQQPSSHAGANGNAVQRRGLIHRSRKQKILIGVVLLELMAVGTLLYLYHINSLPIIGAQYNRYSRRSRVVPRTMKAIFDKDGEEEPCPAVNSNQIYRFISGIDKCMTEMASADISAELNDAWAVTVLRKNAGGGGIWPDSVPEIVDAINTASQSQGLNFQQTSYMVGEGSQVPASITPRDSNRNLRYVVAWGPVGQTPVIFLSAAPAGLQPVGEPAPFLQIISFDPQKKVFNYYQYVNNAQVTDSPSSDEVKTWSWAGDSSHARNMQTVGQGCFGCHLNGSLNMKELTPPWNNWHSTQSTISSLNIPQAVAQDPLFTGLQGADKFQIVFQGAQFNYARNWVGKSISNNSVSNVSELLRRVIATTTVNFAASQTQSQATSDVQSLPNDFFLYDSVLRGVLGLSYTVPPLNLNRTDYNLFLKSNKVALVNTVSNGAPDYLQPGETFFAFYVPVPAFEDTKTIQQLIQQKVVSQQFVAAVLMVDFQNPVFSPARAGLMKYAEQISTARTVPDSADAPTQFAELVSQAASAQPACDTKQLSACTAEQQFLFYYQADWKTRSMNQINAYLQSIANRIVSTQGVNDYMTLAVSRRTQYANYPLICNLREFDLQLPCTSLGSVFVQMNVDGTLSPQPAYSCPTSSGVSPCNSEIYKSFMNQ